MSSCQGTPIFSPSVSLSLKQTCLKGWYGIAARGNSPRWPFQPWGNGSFKFICKDWPCDCSGLPMCQWTIGRMFLIQNLLWIRWVSFISLHMQVLQQQIDNINSLPRYPTCVMPATCESHPRCLTSRIETSNWTVSCGHTGILKHAESRVQSPESSTYKILSGQNWTKLGFNSSWSRPRNCLCIRG